MLKALSVLQLLEFLSRLFDHAAKKLDNKAKVISKFMTSKPGKQTITIHILSKISRSKGNQTMKFGQ